MADDGAGFLLSQLAVQESQQLALVEVPFLTRHGSALPAEPRR
jgi:hypothetical protein